MIILNEEVLYNMGLKEWWAEKQARAKVEHEAKLEALAESKDALKQAYKERYVDEVKNPQQKSTTNPFGGLLDRGVANVRKEFGAQKSSPETKTETKPSMDEKLKRLLR